MLKIIKDMTLLSLGFSFQVCNSQIEGDKDEQDRDEQEMKEREIFGSSSISKLRFESENDLEYDNVENI